MKTENVEPKKLKKASILITIIGIVLAIVSIYLYYDFNKKKETYIPTIGVVVGYDEKIDADYYFTYAAIVEFEVDGEKYQATQSNYSSHPPKIDSKIELRYNKDNPNDVIYDKDSARIWVSIIAALFLVVGITVLISSTRKK